MAIFLEKTELKDAYFEADRVAQEWFKPLTEYERIAGNKLSKTIGKHMPRVNDGSLAASLIETPMNVLPNMQAGKFTSTTSKTAWINELANIIWKTKIVPNANTQASFFDKEQIALYRALKYGAQPRYNFFVTTENYSGSDWSLPYIRNVKLEPGKFSVDDCDYIFMDVFYTKLQLKKIIDQIKEDAKVAKSEGRKADTSWDIKSLEKLVDLSMTSKEIEDQNINERDKQINAAGIKTTVCFQRGIGAPFYMFSKHLEEGAILRTWKNPDPTGDLPITMQYCYETLESPIGIGRVELAGPTQNVLDFFTQAHVLATQLGLQPPKKLKGTIDSTNLSSLVNVPDALWQLGNADIDIVQTSSSVYSQFPANFGLYKSQLQTLQGRTDGSVSATSGNPQFSKTTAGVNMQEERTNAQDNYLRNKADTASARMAEKMMNVHMARMQGADLLDIAEDDKERLMKAGYFDDNPTTEDIPSISEIPILYDELRETFKFEYDARPEADNDEKNRWLELIDIATSNPNVLPAVQQSGYDFKLGEAFKKVISASGADGWDKVLVKIDPEQMAQDMVDPVTGQPMAQPMAQAPQDPNGQPIEQPVENMPQGVTEPPMTPPEAPQEPEIDQDELNVTMMTYGVDEPTAATIIEARKRGFDEQEISQFLQISEGGEQ